MILPRLAFAILLAWFSGASGALAQAPRGDVQGGRDHPLVGRYEGSRIAFHRARDYDELRIPNRRVTGEERRATGRYLGPGNSLEAKGRAVRIRYVGPVNVSTLEVNRNFEEKLKSRGFETLFFCRTQDCGGSDLWFGVTEQSTGSGLPSNWENQTYLAAQLKRPEGDVFVSVLSVAQGGEIHTLVDVVETRPITLDRIVFVDASAMQKSIAETGRVALYGILFDTDRAEIKPESKPTIDEIVKFLRANPGLNVIVAGHTDSQGAFDYNVELSRRRAASVVAALTAQGIGAARLTAFGAGMASPVASNDNDQGRARNRRVEIVKR